MTKLKLIFSLGFFKEAISSLIPTVFVYFDFYSKNFSLLYAKCLGVLTFIVLISIILFLKLREYRISIAKALAYGYFKNYIVKLYELVASKGKNKIEFIFQDTKKSYAPKDIEIKLNLTNSYLDLLKKDRKIKSSYEIAYIDSNAFNYPFFVYAKRKNKKIIIQDIPRTLYSLKYYVNPELDSIEKIDHETKKYFSSFNKELNKLWAKVKHTHGHFELLEPKRKSH